MIVGAYCSSVPVQWSEPFDERGHWSHTHNHQKRRRFTCNVILAVLFDKGCMYDGLFWASSFCSYSWMQCSSLFLSVARSGCRTVEAFLHVTCRFLDHVYYSFLACACTTCFLLVCVALLVPSIHLYLTHVRCSFLLHASGTWILQPCRLSSMAHALSLFIPKTTLA